MLSQLVCASAVNGAWFGWTPGDAVTPLSLVAILETSRTKTREVVQLSQDHKIDGVGRDLWALHGAASCLSRASYLVRPESFGWRWSKAICQVKVRLSLTVWDYTRGFLQRKGILQVTRVRDVWLTWLTLQLSSVFVTEMREQK